MILKIIPPIMFAIFFVYVSTSITTASAAEFEDHTGYIPNWAKNIGNNQASSVCLNIEYGTADSNWCSEFSGYRLDQMLGYNKVAFTDHTGYIPNWVVSIGENQASSICLNVDYGTKDSAWCSEFSGYRLDQMLNKNKKTQTPEKSDKTNDNAKSKAEKIKKAKEDAKKRAEQKKATKTQAKPASTTKTPAKSVPTPKYGAITVSYDELMRNNEKYVGKTVYYKGEIVQVQPIGKDNYILRIAVTNKEFYYDDVIWVNYNGPRVLERDIVDVYGIVIGLKTYTAILNNEITIPEINAKEISVVLKSGDR